MANRTGYFPAYLHQSSAIEELLSPDSRPVVVTTGTGSGKSEAFLLPAIKNAIDDAVKFCQSGLTAILVYPMNSLANDQLLHIYTNAVRYLTFKSETAIWRNKGDRGFLFEQSGRRVAEYCY